MYLGKVKQAGTFTGKDVLKGQLLTGQREILWYLRYTRAATPNLISIATNLSVKTVEKYLQILINEFGLVKRLKLTYSYPSYAKIPTNLYSLSLRGYRKLGIRTNERFSWKEMLGGSPLSEHRLLIAEIIAYLFRNDALRKKGEEIDFLDNESKWRQKLERKKEDEKKRLEKKYGVDSYNTKVAIKQFGEKIAKAPIPDVHCSYSFFPGLHFLESKGLEKKEGLDVFFEIETGKDRKGERLDEKLRRYEKNIPFFQEHLLIFNFVLIFIAPTWLKANSLEQRLEKAPHRWALSYPVFVLRKDDLAERLKYHPRRTKPL